MTDILVIGSVHLDAIANFEDAGQETAVDKIGAEFRLGVGGTAYNIAQSLKTLGHEPYLFSALNRQTNSAPIIDRALDNKGLRADYLLDDPTLGESAFVALFRSGELFLASSHTNVDQSQIITDTLPLILPNFEWVIADCNLSQAQIEAIAADCQRHGANLIGAATSEAKAPRFLASAPHTSRAFTMNAREAHALQIASDVAFDDREALRQTVRTELLLVTQGAAGFDIITPAGATSHKPPQVLNPRHTNGAGDAATAALTHALVAGAPIPDTIHAFTADSLAQNE